MEPFSKELFAKKTTEELKEIEASYLRALNQVTPVTGALIIKATSWIRQILKEREEGKNVQ
jgi:hypothetical protein